MGAATPLSDQAARHLQGIRDWGESERLLGAVLQAHQETLDLLYSVTRELAIEKLLRGQPLPEGAREGMDKLERKVRAAA